MIAAAGLELTPTVSRNQTNAANSSQEIVYIPNADILLFDVVLEAVAFALIGSLMGLDPIISAVLGAGVELYLYYRN